MEQRAHFKKIAKDVPEFQKLRRHALFLRLLITGLDGFLFYSFREQLGLFTFVGFVLTNLFVEWWIERNFILPVASLHMKEERRPVIAATGLWQFPVFAEFAIFCGGEEDVDWVALGIDFGN